MTRRMHDLLSPAVPAGAYDDLLARVLSQARAQRAWTPDDGPLPALFVSHGAPPTPDDARWLDSLFSWSQAMPKPRAIVVVSAPWENAPLAISGALPALRCTTTSAASTRATTPCSTPPRTPPPWRTASPRP
jgi:4,5-DOPA dioxygenase extradiol